MSNPDATRAVIEAARRARDEALRCDKIQGGSKTRTYGYGGIADWLGDALAQYDREAKDE